MTKEQIARALNEWMRVFSEDPAAFEREFVTVSRHIAEMCEGRQPSYGEAGVAYMEKLLADMA